MCVIWRHILPECLMPDGQFAILRFSVHLFKTVLLFWTHVGGVEWGWCVVWPLRFYFELDWTGLGLGLGGLRFED